MDFIKLFFFQQVSEKKAQGLMHASKFSTTVILEEPMFSNIMLFLDTFEFYIVMWLSNSVHNNKISVP